MYIWIEKRKQKESKERESGNCYIKTKGLFEGS
jgi:hypothetical protein